MNHAHTLQQLHSLRLTGMADAFSQQLNQPNTYEELGFIERFSLLVNNEATCRDNRKITRLLRQARLRLHAQAADIDYQARRGLHRDTMAQLLQLDWVRQHRNLLIEGPTGTGKTFIACALGQTITDHSARRWQLWQAAHPAGENRLHYHRRLGAGCTFPATAQ